MARALAKYRINPGNVNIGKKHDDNFRTMIEAAIEYDRPVRIGVNWGSLDQALLTRMMDENNRAARAAGRHDRHAARDRGERDRIGQGGRAVRPAAATTIILSAKVSGVQDLIAVYRMLAAECDYALHLGLTEAGMGSKGIVASTAAHRRAAAGRHRRYDSRFADAAAERRSHRRSDRRASRFCSRSSCAASRRR